VTTTAAPSPAYREYLATRDALQANRTDLVAAQAGFTWPRLAEFNWALEHIDAVGADPVRGARLALWIVEEDGSEARYTYADMSERSNRVAVWLRSQGVGRGDRVILMLANQVELWDTILAVMKLGAVLIPTTTMMGPADLRDRVERGGARHVVVRSEDTAKFDDVPGSYTRIAVGEPVEGWLPHADSASASADFTVDGVTRGDDTLLLYFTSGTTAKPKLVEHTHTSYPGATCPRCTGSACSPATCTSTSPLPVGPSTPGATSSRRGSPRPACSSSTTPASTPTASSTRSSGAERRPSARRRRCGGCSSRPTSAGCRSRCASWSGPASR
jgi:hypothetical protein